MFSCILVIYDATCSEFVKITFLKVVLVVPGISQSIKKDLNYQTLADKITEFLKQFSGTFDTLPQGAERGRGRCFTLNIILEKIPKTDVQQWLRVIIVLRAVNFRIQCIYSSPHSFYSRITLQLECLVERHYCSQANAITPDARLAWGKISHDPWGIQSEYMHTGVIWYSQLS